MRKLQGVALLGVLLVALIACRQPNPGNGGGGAFTGIVGYVVNANAGEAVANSQVTVYDHGTATQVAQTSTDTDGAYEVNLAPGSYDILLAKAGYAGSQVLNVRVEDGKTTNLNIIQRTAFNPSWPTDPPQVTLGKVQDGNVYDAALGYIPYDVTVTPAAPLATDLIYAALGKTPGSGFTSGQRDIFASTSTTGDQFLDPLAYAAAGPTTFQVVAYDTNGNRTQILRYVEVSVPFSGGLDLVAPQLMSALSVTLGKQIQFFSVSPMAAPAGTNLYVELTWQPKTDFSHFPNDVPYGYHVYRSFDGQNFERIGTVDGSTTSFVDAGPELAPGKTVTYRVTAFVGDNESDPSNALETTPLEPFDVQLTAPADRATGVSTSPTFQWTATPTAAGLHYYYAGALWDTLSGDKAWLTGGAQPLLVDRNDWTWNEDGAYSNRPLETLQRGRSYEWQLIEAYALDDLVHPTAVSIAADGLGLWFPYGVASTDHFTFTTAP